MIQLVLRTLVFVDFRVQYVTRAFGVIFSLERKEDYISIYPEMVKILKSKTLYTCKLFFCKKLV